jgi:hypothetical protein
LIFTLKAGDRQGPGTDGAQRNEQPQGCAGQRCTTTVDGFSAWGPLQEDGSEWGEGHWQRLFAAHVRYWFGVNTAHIADIGAPVDCRVRVQDLLIEAMPRRTNAVAFAHHRRRIDDDDHYVVRAFAMANEGEGTVVGIVAVDPLETVPVEVNLMQRGLSGVESIQIGDKVL